MIEGDPIAELTGETQAKSREDNARNRLRGWLDRMLWSGSRNTSGPMPWPESVCILAGLDPEASADADPAGWALLPGSLAFYGFNTFPQDRHGLYALRASVEEHIGLLLGLGLKTMAPKKAIAAASAAGIPIPWNDGGSAVKATAASEANRMRRLTQLDGDDKTKLIVGAGRDAFDRIVANDFKGFRHEEGKRKGLVNRRAVAKDMLASIKIAAGDDSEDLPQIEALLGRITNWLPPDADKPDMRLPGTL